MYKIARPINGIPLNGLEYLCEHEVEVRCDTEEDAIQYLVDITDYTMEHINELLSDGGLVIVKEDE